MPPVSFFEVFFAMNDISYTLDDLKSLWWLDDFKIKKSR